MLIVVRYGHPVLLPDSAEAGQLSGDVLADLGCGRDQHGPEAGLRCGRPSRRAATIIRSRAWRRPPQCPVRG